MKEGLLTAHKVRFSYGTDIILDEINAEFHSGRIYGILGSNGSGKTTLLDLLCGILSPDSGEIFFRGRNVTTWQRRALSRGIALVPQEFSIPFGFTVRQVVEMGRNPWLNRFENLSANDHDIVEKAMCELGLMELQNRAITSLSGGEKQRAIVARALAQTPEIIILDEATSNLDIMHVISILEVIQRRVAEKGLTVITSIHDINMAAMFCEEMMFMKEGKVIISGSVEETMTANTLHEIFGIESRVRFDDFSGTPTASFRLKQENL